MSNGTKMAMAARPAAPLGGAIQRRCPGRPGVMARRFHDRPRALRFAGRLEEPVEPGVTNVDVGGLGHDRVFELLTGFGCARSARDQTLNARMKSLDDATEA